MLKPLRLYSRIVKEALKEMKRPQKEFHKGHVIELYNK